MRNFTITYLLSLFLFCLTYNTHAQEIEYQATSCGQLLASAASCVDGGTQISIAVAGEGIMGTNNRGIVEVFADVDQPNFFEGEINLISPSGLEYLMASSSEGISSFPGYAGTVGGEILDVKFRNCAYLNPTSSNVTPSGMTFYPVETFSPLNDGVTSPNGTWNIEYCTLSGESMDIYCASVTFGTLCPEITNATVTDASCSTSTDGSVTFDHIVGQCADEFIVFSINGVDYQDSNTFTGLSAGEYTGYVAISVPAAPPGVQGNSSAVEECITEFAFTISSNDNEAPTLTNCPVNQTLEITENCAVVVDFTDATYDDNCSVANATVEFIEPDGDIFSYDFNSGETVGTTFFQGETTVTYTVTDDSGNTASCQAVITAIDAAPPTWTNASVTVNIECGVDDIDQTVADNLAQLTGIDNCGTVEIVFNSNDITPQCGASQWNDWFYTLTDESGNTAPQLGEILINVNDNIPPTITGVPADMTINCTDDFPDIPPVGAGGVTASDLCEGDMTDAITISSSLLLGDCTQGQAVEVHSYSYQVADGCDNETIESFTISVFNNMPPIVDAPFVADGVLTIVLECGVDNIDATIASNIPTGTGCSGDLASVLTNEFTSPLCGDLSNALVYVSDYSITDECNNQVLTYLDIRYEDTQPPVITGIPANVTINCNDDAPIFPMITALDVCEGDVTDLIDYDLTVTALSCGLNTNTMVETHTWTATDYCNNAQSAVWTVTIFNDEAVELGDDVIACVGETVSLSTSGLTGTYLWSTGETSPSITVGLAATYSVTVTGNSGCCSIDEISVSYQDTPNASATGGSLDCSGTAITIMGTSTSSNVTYTWTGPGGFTSDDQNPSVSQAGTYTLTVSTSAGCIATATAEVLADTDAPDVTTEGGIIDCNTATVTISGESTTAGVTYAWTGPNGYSSSMQNPTVDVPGEYNLVVTANNGCIAEGIAVVEDDSAIPTITATGGTIDCDDTEVTISTTTSDPDATFAWTGPGGFTSTETNPTVGAAGTYAVTITSDNGCTNSAATMVTMDTEVPNLTASGAEIDCTNPQVQIMATSSTATVTYQWTGPNGFSSNEASPTVDQAGDYTITVASPNGCTAEMTVNVSQNTTVPALSVEDAQIDCTSPMVTLSSTTETAVTFQWTGPDGFSSTEEAPTVSTAGDYVLTVTASNGCTASETVTVTEDIAVPTFTTSDGMIDCTNPMTQLIITSSDNDLIYSWVGPDGFVSDEQNPTVDTPGSYSVTATGTNGCQTTSAVVVTEDITVPNATAMGGEISCDANTVQISGMSTTANVTFSWTGPNDFSSDTQNPQVGSPGTYVLTVTGPNGCTATANVEVTADADLPNITASGGTLDCTITEVQLMGNSTDAGVTYLWTGPDGLNTNEQNPTVSSAGIYTLTVSSDNGCSSETQVTVDLDDNLPTVIALGGQISCAQSSITLVGNSTNEVSYSWTGPNGFTSTDQNPSASDPGEYTLTVTGENGCTNATTVIVEADADLPVAAFEDPQIDCDANTITLTLATGEPYSYQWTFDGDVISTGASADISDAGDYSVQVTAANGCSITLSYTLDHAITDVQADIATTDATASADGTASIELDTDNIVSILWDNGQIGAQATGLSVGEHTVTVTTGYGCVYTFSFEIMMNTAIGEIEILEALEVYPTVFQNYVTVNADLSQSAQIKILIFDSSGRLSSTVDLGLRGSIRESIALDNLATGTYMLSIQADNQVLTKRLIKI